MWPLPPHCRRHPPPPWFAVLLLSSLLHILAPLCIPPPPPPLIRPFSHPGLMCPSSCFPLTPSSPSGDSSRRTPSSAGLTLCRRKPSGTTSCPSYPLMSSTTSATLWTVSPLTHPTPTSSCGTVCWRHILRLTGSWRGNFSPFPTSPVSAPPP